MVLQANQGLGDRCRGRNRLALPRPYITALAGPAYVWLPEVYLEHAYYCGWCHHDQGQDAIDRALERVFFEVLGELRAPPKIIDRRTTTSRPATRIRSGPRPPITCRHPGAPPESPRVTASPWLSFSPARRRPPSPRRRTRPCPKTAGSHRPCGSGCRAPPPAAVPRFPRQASAAAPELPGRYCFRRGQGSGRVNREVAGLSSPGSATSAEANAEPKGVAFKRPISSSRDSPRSSNSRNGS